MAIIELDGVTRDFVGHTGGVLRRRRVVKHAVTDLTFGVEPGEAVGYLGANGSGKSTTIKMLTGILVPSAGRIRVCGLDPVPQRQRLARRLGVLFGQRSILWWDLPLRESFPILAAMYDRPRAAWRARERALVDGLDLGEFWDRPVRQLSLGQRMRGELAAALIHEPELVVLDEPTIGLDMLSKERLRAFLAEERRARGTTLLLTTHDMGDVQRLCERMIIIDGGRRVFDGTAAQLERETGAERVLIVDTAGSAEEAGPGRAAGAADRLARLALPAGARVEGVDGARLRVAFGPGVTAAEVLAAVSRGAEVVDISLAEPEIEDLVRSIYLRGSRPAGAPQP